MENRLSSVEQQQRFSFHVSPQLHPNFLMVTLLDLTNLQTVLDTVSYMVILHILMQVVVAFTRAESMILPELWPWVLPGAMLLSLVER